MVPAMAKDVEAARVTVKASGKAPVTESASAKVPAMASVKSLVRAMEKGLRNAARAMESGPRKVRVTGTPPAKVNRASPACRSASCYLSDL